VIEDFHCGGNELVRVVDGRTQSGAFHRAVHKLSPLPIDAESSIIMRCKHFNISVYLLLLSLNQLI
jgi:hypothetical protein